ncbi:MAG: hypothetical protein OER88_03530 [Planctomycetota bacterium]|nr:hypothetical protein [Planctomycetota bacterium]
MRTLPIAVLAGLAGAAALMHTPISEGGEGDHAGKIFAARCATCHVIPDPALRTDRAWLAQVKETS